MAGPTELHRGPQPGVGPPVHNGDAARRRCRSVTDSVVFAARSAAAVVSPTPPHPTGRSTMNDDIHATSLHRAEGDPLVGAPLPADAGMATAEYAVATLAAVGFAGLLLTVLRSGEVQELLLDLVRRALAVAG